MRLQRKGVLRGAVAGLAALSGVLALAACGSDGDPSKSSGASSTAASSASSSGSASAGSVKCGKAASVRASGSTAQQRVMQDWIKSYEKACSGTRIRYEGSGSGAGQRDFLSGRTAFAGTDSPLTAAQVDRSKACSEGGRPVHLPILGGPIAVAFHLPGVDELTLDAATLAKIFNGRITSWDDAAIAELNPRADLPSTPIRALHRSDASGTTDNFTSYLRAAAKADWPYEHDKEWPAEGGGSAKGSADLARQVKGAEGAIGYVELAYAIGNNVPTAAIDTGASDPVNATVINASKALAGAETAGTDGDLVLRPDYSTKAAGAYPIAMVTYEVVCSKGNKAASWPTTKAFLDYIAGSEGQRDLSFQGYATLPAQIMDKVRQKIGKLS